MRNAMLAAAAVLVASPLAAQDAVPPPGPYARAIAAARAALDAGDLDRAAEHLETTDPAARGFEFTLLAESVAARRAGKRAPGIRVLPKPEGVETRYAVLDPAHQRAAFLCRDGGLRVVDLTRPDAPPRVVPDPKGQALWSGAFSRDGTTFVGGHQDGRALVWDAQTWELRRTVELGDDWPVRQLAVAPDGSTFAAEGKQELLLIDARDGRRIGAIGPRYNFGEGLAFSPKGDRVATGGMFHILLFDAKTAEPKGEIEHASYTMGLCFSPDGAAIASAPRGNVNKLLTIFDLADGRARFPDLRFASYIQGLAFSPDGKRLVATDCSNQVRLIDAATGAIVFAWERPGCAAEPAFGADGRLLVWSSPAGLNVLGLDLDPGPPPGPAPPP